MIFGGGFNLSQVRKSGPGAPGIVILGEDELQSGILTVKDFSTGIQTRVALAELAGFLAEQTHC